MRMTRSYSSSVTSLRWPKDTTPELEQTISNWPKCSTAESIRRMVSETLPMSAWMARASPPWDKMVSTMDWAAAEEWA